MMVKDKAQKGLALVESLIIILVLAIIGFGGWWVWQNHRNNEVSSYAECLKTPGANIETIYPPICSVDGKTFTEPNTKMKTDQSSSSSGSAQKYLTIKEWGIKLGFTDADKVTYVISTDYSGNQAASLKLLNSVASVCQDLGVGMVRDSSSQMGGTHLGSYYYYIAGGPGACSDDPGGINGSINQLRAKIDGEELGTGHYVITSE